MYMDRLRVRMYIYFVKLKSERINREEDLRVVCVILICKCVCCMYMDVLNVCACTYIYRSSSERINREEDLQVMCVCRHIRVCEWMHENYFEDQQGGRFAGD